MTREEVVARSAPLLSALPPEIVCVYLFGSYARGTQRPGSDIDLAFFRRQPSAPLYAQQPYALAAQLELALGREVELTELNHAPPDLVHEVLRDGIILLDRDPDLRVRLEVAARAIYLDMLPVLQRYRQRKASA